MVSDWCFEPVTEFDPDARGTPDCRGRSRAMRPPAGPARVGDSDKVGVLPARLDSGAIAMRNIHQTCCGLDVHKRTVTACLLTRGARGRTEKTIRTVGTMTRDLEELAAWLQEAGCEQVAMESTGVYWKPVYNVLERTCREVLLVNAQHIKHVPGRKTDVKDAEWIAELLSHGLLTGSFVPPQEIRELRELTRYRQSLIQERARLANRIQKLLEGGNIKLASVASDVLGVSGRDMLAALAQGEDDLQVMAEMARGRLRTKIPELVEALRGVLSETQRWLLGEQLREVAHHDESIARLNERIEELTRPFVAVISHLCEIPGVSARVAEVIVAEIGLDMRRFPTASNLASWAGMCPGSHESAGKRQSGRCTAGNRHLKAILTEAAWAAGRTKDTYLASKYHALAHRRGKKKACIGTGHAILKICHYLISHPEEHYRDLGPEWLDKFRHKSVTNHLVHRLEGLGYKVQLEQTPKTAA